MTCPYCDGTRFSDTWTCTNCGARAELLNDWTKSVVGSLFFDKRRVHGKLQFMRQLGVPMSAEDQAGNEEFLVWR